MCKVIGIKYEIRPPRLCGLRLRVMTDDYQLGPSFDLKYHDITDVIDFLVLRQLHNTAMTRSWKIGWYCYLSLIVDSFSNLNVDKIVHIVQPSHHYFVYFRWDAKVWLFVSICIFFTIAYMCLQNEDLSLIYVWWICFLEFGQNMVYNF